MASELEEIAKTAPGFDEWKHAEKIVFFGWYLHTYEKLERFTARNVRECYERLHIEQPANLSSSIASLESSKPKRFLRDSRGIYLAKQSRDPLDTRFGQRASVVQIHQLLQSLPGKIPNIIERDFLNETLICFKHGAFRAAIVMCWNLAYDHLCEYILANKISEFNTQLPKSFPKAKISQIATKDDFADFKESECLQICKSAGIASNNIYKILTEKLGRRNSAAHPSTIVITQLQAEDFINDLVSNVVLKFV